MADAATKQMTSINGGAFISDFKSVFTHLKTRRTFAFAYGFMFAFVAFTVFLAFNPSSNSSSSSSFWFTNIFSTSTASSSASDGSYRSQFSSVFSYFNTNNSSAASPPQAQNISSSSYRSNNSASLAPSVSQKLEPASTKNQTQKSADSDKFVNLHANQTASADKESGHVKNQNGSTKESTGKVQNLKPKQTSTVDKTKAAPKAVNQSLNSSSVAQDLKANQTATVDKTKVAPQAVNQSLNSSSVAQNLKANQTSKVDKPKASEAVNGSNNSSSLVMGSTGNGAKKGADRSNYVASLSKKQSDGKMQSNGTDDSGVLVKRGMDSLIQNLLKCDLFDGEWVHDDSYPLYKPGACSFIDEQFSCVLNGRSDKNFQKMKWKPKGCSLPRMNGAHMLELLRGKRLVFVGDSLNRNMWESLVCILRSSAKDPKKVFEAHGRYHFRGEVSYSFVFKDYNCTVEFFVSPFLVQEWEMPDKNGSKKETLRLDLVGRSSDQYKGAEIIIFNTGHWWTHEKTSRGKDYYQEGSHVYGELNVLEAFRKALTTWARWVDANVNPTKSMVFFRGYSASHFSGGQWNSGGACDSETEPIKNKTYLTAYPPKMRVLESVLKGMKTHVTYLNITRLTDYRKDGHPSIYRKRNLSDEERRSPLRYQDCSHWCLPGVPDAWNELFYAELLIKENKMLQHENQKKYR